MNIVIIEDEALAANKLEQMAMKYDPNTVVLEKISSVEDAVEWFKENDLPDLAFLDIQLSDGTSFDILREVEIDCPVIFTTAYDEYALQAFDLHSIAYLLKPVTFEKLSTAIDKLKKMLGSSEEIKPSEAIDKLLGALNQEKKSYKSRFLVKSGNTILSVGTEKIAYFFSEDKVAFLVTHEGKKYALNQSLDQLEQMLDPYYFFRVNRQIIVRVEAVKAIHPYFKGRLLLDLQPDVSFEVVVSSSKAPELKDWLDQ
ncbi:LytTR family DNA-binding domain-containing protein [Flammeovirgaceae bacterium SG7u.111]|nr:LytTR family DNA-binding domain-containing protein [Flammeovirgaceae bacterium SG7u.132]WPO34581.1 LytTR family DNA-binding domain-containing protein [Flammeovirgaceae bacterium SG7u.111]